ARDNLQVDQEASAVGASCSNLAFAGRDAGIGERRYDTHNGSQVAFHAIAWPNLNHVRVVDWVDWVRLRSTVAKYGAPDIRRLGSLGALSLCNRACGYEQQCDGTYNEDLLQTNACQ